MVEFFKLSAASKVTALTLTVAKAFNIAYKAWLAEKRQKAKETSILKGSESPLPIRRKIKADDDKSTSSFLKKMAPGIAGTDGGPYTPPAGRKITQEESKAVKRSGSFGDIPCESASKNPAVMRVQAHNDVTGSTHMLMLTDDFDSEFQRISDASEKPDLLTTNLSEEQPDQFNWDEVMKFTDDPSSVDDAASTD